ncbi:MAG: PKD domain-containing protein [Candidatus Aenigmarchaeota archaeon]|nr:PKD domain-containing protein [Candidatus Aenigmarchaeota archaeon]
MKRKFDYTKSTFYVSLVILVVVLFMASPYVTSVGFFSIQPSTQPIEPVCGDSLIEGNEVCDSDTVDCSTIGDYLAGDYATCLPNCLGYDVFNDCISAVPVLDQEAWGDVQYAAGRTMPGAQTFTPEVSGILSHIQLYASDTPTSDCNKYVSLVVRKTDLNGLPNGDIIGSNSVPIKDVFDTLTFNLTGQNVSLIAGEKYAIYLSCGAWTYSYMPNIIGVDYLGGIGYKYYSGNLWDPYGDYAFRTYMLIQKSNPPYAIFNYYINERDVTFSSEGSYDPEGVITYNWNFGDGTTSTEQKPTHTFEPGTYNVNLTVYDEDGQSSSYADTITILNAQPVVLISVDKSTAYVDEEIVFDGTNSYDTDGSIESYEWTFGDEASINPPRDDATIMAIAPITLPVEPSGVTTHSYSHSGTYTVTLTVTDNDGSSSSTEAAITINPLPEPVPVGTITVSAGVDKSAYVGDEVNLTGFTFCSAEPCNEIDGYAWDFGDGSLIWNSVLDSSIIHIYTAAGTYTATFTAIDNESNELSDTATITISNIPTTETGATGGGGGGGGFGIPVLPLQGGLNKTIVNITTSESILNQSAGETPEAQEQPEITPLSWLLIIVVLLAMPVLFFIRLKSRSSKNLNNPLAV